jgi:transposase-like protein
MRISSRRYFSMEKKKGIIAELLTSGSTLRAFARNRGISVSVICRWKKELLEFVKEDLRAGVRIAGVGAASVDTKCSVAIEAEKFLCLVAPINCLETISQLREKLARVEGERDALQRVLNRQCFNYSGYQLCRCTKPKSTVLPSVNLG